MPRIRLRRNFSWTAVKKIECETSIYRMFASSLAPRGATINPYRTDLQISHLKRDRGAEFPDAVTARGTKHLGELAKVASSGGRSVMIYLVQREDCADFRVAADIDPTYDAAFAEALDNGVEALCYACRLTTDGIDLDAPLPIIR